MTERKKEEPLFMRWARAEKRMAEIDRVEPYGWVWVEGMKEPRLIDFDKIEDEDEPSS